MDFQTIYNRLKDTKTFQDFQSTYEGYHLAHGFVQLDANLNESKPWHVGFYSEKDDKLAVFTSPEFELTFDEAFKEQGTIQELQLLDSFQSTSEILHILMSRLDEAYPKQIPYTWLVILQMIEGQPRYNITVVSQSFAMITFQVDPLTGAIIKENEQSVLDLKAE